MKKIWMLVCALCLSFIFASCTGSSKATDNTADEIRAKYQVVNAFSVTADIRADYGEYIWDYTLEYSGNAGTGDITVISPELIAGLKAKYDSGKSSIIFEDAVLDTGELTADGLTPMGAVPVLIKAWAEGYIMDSYSEVWNGEDCIVIESEVTDSVSQKTWFLQSDFSPLRSELITEGRTVITCVFSDVYIN